MEKTIVRFLSSVSLAIRIPYRLVCLVYPVQQTTHQKGAWIEGPYLNSAYKLKIRLFSKDLIDHRILFTGAYEGTTNLILQRYVKPNAVVVEAGADSGTETLLISRLVGPLGKVYAFEPVEHVRQKLEKNLRLNDIQNVEVMNTVLGESDSEILFSIYPEEHPNQGMGSKSLENATLRRIMVQQTTLDSLMTSEAALKSLDFLKMDVQGAEADILRGGMECITRFKPYILLEACEINSCLIELHDLLKDLNYSVFCVAESAALEVLSQFDLKAGNWLAIPAHV